MWTAEQTDESWAALRAAQKAQEMAERMADPRAERRVALPVSQSVKPKEACSADRSVANLAAKKARWWAELTETSSAVPMVAQTAGEMADHSDALRAERTA